MPSEVLFLVIGAIAMVIYAAVIWCDYSEQIDEVNDD